MAAIANLTGLIGSFGSFRCWPRSCRLRTGFGGKPLNLIYTTAFEGFAALHLRCWPDFGRLTCISRPETFVTAVVISTTQGEPANPLGTLPVSSCHRLHWLKLAAKALHLNQLTSRKEAHT